MKLSKEERNKLIVESEAVPKEAAEAFGVSTATVYRVRREAQEKAKSAARGGEQEDYADMRHLDGRLLFDQATRSGVSFHGGQITEEFQRNLRDDGGVKIFTEMSVHPVASAVLFAISMAQRQISWFFEPASDKPEDEQRAEWVEGAMHDMSQTWDDVVSQVFRPMLIYGFNVAELVYKKRLGQSPQKYVEDPARSRYTDGKIGWRRWQFISPRSMPSGSRWEFDDNGRVQAVRQQAAPDYQTVTLPMEKGLLFRPTVEWDNPEGQSVLRPMYQSWYYARNLEEIEAIGAERLGVGLPVIYLGDGCTMTGAGSDYEKAIDMARNIRTDQQMGIVIPKTKLTSDGRGMLVELMSPPSRGFVDFNQVIERHEKRMAMTVLAQFIFLGMLQVGTQALNESATDTFQMTISAWADMVAAVVNRFAVPRLFALNGERLEELPELRHTDVGVPDLPGVAEFVNKLVGSQVLTPDGALEDHLREIAKLPERQKQEVAITPDAGDEGEQGEGPELGPEPQEPEPEQGPPEVEAASLSVDPEDAEAFALRLRRGGPKWERQTNAYERELRRTYQGWADKTATDLSKVEEDADFDEKLEEAVEALIAALLLMGRQQIPRAHALGLAGVPTSPGGMRELADAVASNDGYLLDSLRPDIEAKVRKRLQEDPMIRTDRLAMTALLGTFIARVGSYAGAYWSTIMQGLADRMRQEPKKVPVYWALDPRVTRHCNACLLYGDKEYPSWDDMVAMTNNVWPSNGTDCDGNCRCSIYARVKGQRTRVWTHLATSGGGLPLVRGM